MFTAIRSVIKLMIGFMIFLGLPLMGWGEKDAHGFIAHPARFAYIVLIILLQLFIVIKIPEVGRNRGKGKKIVARQRLAVLLMQLISLKNIFNDDSIAWSDGIRIKSRPLIGIIFQK